MSKPKPKALVAIPEDYLAAIKAGFDHAIELEQKEEAGEPVQPAPYPRPKPQAEPPVTLKNPKRLDTSRFSLSTHTGYKKAGFYLDREMLDELGMLSIQLHKNQSELMNLALYELLVNLKPELEDPN